MVATKEDEEILNKRKEKFGGIGGGMEVEDKQKLQERQKKFGKPEADINLDD